MRRQSPTVSVIDQGVDASVCRMALCGLCASLIGIGLSRFAYTALLPELIVAHWFAPSLAAYLGAANLAGYLAGALVAQPIASRMSVVGVLRAMMLLGSAAFFACASPVSFSWLFLWRFASGVSGGVLMVLVAPTVLPNVSPSRRGLAGGAIFVGIGCGIVASGALVPALLRWGLPQTWAGLGTLALALSVVAWNGWPVAGPATRRIRLGGRRFGSLFRNPALRALYLQYALNAFGLVPHMIFLVDFVARGVGKGLAAGAQDWVLFGLGAMAGPVCAGYIGDRVGFRSALRLAFLIQAAAVAILAVNSRPISLTVSSLVIGAFVPGIVPLTLGRVHELIPGDTVLQKSAWSLCTTAFALGQAAGAYALSAIFAQTKGAYAPLFMLGGGALMLAFTVDMATAVLAARCGEAGADGV